MIVAHGSGDPLRPHGLSATERKRVLEAASDKHPFLAWRGSDGVLRIERLEDPRSRTLGRRPAMDIVIDDPQVSGLHARLECHAGEWSIIDDGLSKNGTFVDEDRVKAHERLAGDRLIRLGRTIVAFKAPVRPAFAPTASDHDPPPLPPLTAQQRAVLVALCRPLLDDPPARLPASNGDVACELQLSVGAVKMHLRSLFAKFQLAHVKQNEKRLRLAFEAIERGAVGRSDIV